jgi:formylglycine-generating enzyme required for sulfatase activity
MRCPNLNRRTVALLLIFAEVLLLAVCTTTYAAEKPAGEGLELIIAEMKWRFHYCPAGAFTMGTPRSDDEQPHPVTLSQGFWMGETEVTQEQWEAVMGNNPSSFKGEKLPVEQVSWHACQEFVEKLNALDAAPKGYKFALPTESQWEYACRAGSTTAYCFGDDANGLDAYGWYSEDYRGDETHAVGTKKANTWGLYDMHGNVYEWCNDWYGGYPGPTASSVELTDPVGASSGSDRVIRSGGWCSYSGICRSAYRSYSPPEFTDYCLGVRVSLVSGGE